jgi:hypothetical protein
MRTQRPELMHCYQIAGAPRGVLSEREPIDSGPSDFISLLKRPQWMAEAACKGGPSRSSQSGVDDHKSEVDLLGVSRSKASVWPTSRTRAVAAAWSVFWAAQATINGYAGSAGGARERSHKSAIGVPYRPPVSPAGTLPNPPGRAYRWPSVAICSSRLGLNGATVYAAFVKGGAMSDTSHEDESRPPNPRDEPNPFTAGVPVSPTLHGYSSSHSGKPVKRRSGFWAALRQRLRRR